MDCCTFIQNNGKVFFSTRISDTADVSSKSKLNEESRDNPIDKKTEKFGIGSTELIRQIFKIK
jgi:hypothetical protein